MDKQKRLKKAHSLLDTKVKTTEHKKQQSQQMLDDLNGKKKMLVTARQSCSGARGERISAISCWSRNDFVQLIDKVSLLVEKEISEEQQRLNSIESQLNKEIIQEKGIEHLKTQHNQKVESLREKQEQQEVEDRLQRSPSQKQT